MVVVPILKPETKPLGVMLATLVFDETQAFEIAGVVVDVNVIDSPTLTDVVPEITGNGFTTTLTLVVFTAVQTPLVTTAR